MNGIQETATHLPEGWLPCDGRYVETMDIIKIDTSKRKPGYYWCDPLNTDGSAYGSSLEIGYWNGAHWYFALIEDEISAELEIRPLHPEPLEPFIAFTKEQETKALVALLKMANDDVTAGRTYTVEEVKAQMAERHKKVIGGMKYDLNKHEKMDRERIANGLKKALLYVMIALGLTFLVLILTIFTSGHAQAASFDCTKASAPVELSICSDEVLGALDEDIAALYKQALAADPKVKAAQRQWLKERNKMSGSALVVTHMERKSALQAMIAAPVAVANEPVDPETVVVEVSAPKPVAKDTYDMAPEERGRARRDNDARVETERLEHNKKIASKHDAANAILDYIDEYDQFPKNFGWAASGKGDGVPVNRLVHSSGKNQRCAEAIGYQMMNEVVTMVVNSSGRSLAMAKGYRMAIYNGAHNATVDFLENNPDRYSSFCK